MRVAVFFCAALLVGSIAEAQTPAASRIADIREPLRRLPRHDRERRRARTGDCRADSHSNRSGLDDAPSRGAARRGHAGVRRPVERRGAPISSASCARCGRRTDPGPARVKVALAGGGTLEGLVMNQSSRRHAAARRRPADPPASQDRQPIPQRHLAGRLGELQRRDQRQPLQSADADQQEQRGHPGAEVDLQPAQHIAAAGDAGRRRRRDVCDERERVLRPRRRQRPGDLALPASADERAGRQRRRRREPRRQRRRRSPVHGHRSRAPHRAQPPYRRAPVGNRDGGLAPELQRDRRAAACRQPRRHRHVGWRRRRARIRRRLRSVDRQRSVAVLDGAAARRAWIRDVAGQGNRAPGRDDVDDGRVRSAARHHLLDGGQPGTGSDRRRSRAATISIPIRSWRSMRRPAR